MSRLLLISILSLTFLGSRAQSADSSKNRYTNSADNLLSKSSRILFGGYGEVHYNQPFGNKTMNNGQLDVHRVVMLFGYNFNNRTQFVTEVEYEHVREVYVEQAFIQHRINSYLNFRGGLLLIPMGITNEYHEPTTFNGVERPLVDKYITPTTWREIGIGLNGNLLSAYLKYQFYLVNGFNGYDGAANLSGKNGLRKGRQKGAESFSSAPNFAGKIEFYGIRGLNVGLSGYFGPTQSTLYDGVNRNDIDAIATADSSVVGISMIGADLRYNRSGFLIRGQFYLTSLSNSAPYNAFTADDEGNQNDLGSSMMGYYGEVGYNVFRWMKTSYQLIPFVRYEFLNTHHAVGGDMDMNPTYQTTNVTAGLTFMLSKGAVLKTDLQFVKKGNEEQYSKLFNAGIGVWF